MRINWNFLKLMALMFVVIGLYAFSNGRNQARNITGMKVEFVGDQNLYLTEGTVNKLLIQKYGSLKNVPKEKLV